MDRDCGKPQLLDLTAVAVQRERPGQRVNLYVIVNSPRLAVPQCVTDHVLLVALRTSDVWTGERANDSLALAMTDAARRGWTARYVTPDGDLCQPVPPPEDYCNPPFTQCQFEYGRRLALEDGSNWQVRIDTLSPFEIKPVTQQHPSAR